MSTLNIKISPIINQILKFTIKYHFKNTIDSPLSRPLVAGRDTSFLFVSNSLLFPSTFPSLQSLFLDFDRCLSNLPVPSARASSLHGRLVHSLLVPGKMTPLPITIEWDASVSGAFRVASDLSRLTSLLPTQRKSVNSLKTFLTKVETATGHSVRGRQSA